MTTVMQQVVWGSVSGVLGLMYLMLVLVEHYTSKSSVTEVRDESGKVVSTTEVTPKGIDLEIPRYVVGLGSVVSLLYLFQLLGLFNS